MKNAVLFLWLLFMYAAVIYGYKLGYRAACIEFDEQFVKEPIRELIAEKP